MSVKELGVGARLRIKFLYSKLQASLSPSEGHFLFTLLNFSSSWAPWPLLHTAALSILPNVVLGQGNQPLEGHLG